MVITDMKKKQNRHSSVCAMLSKRSKILTVESNHLKSGYVDAKGYSSCNHQEMCLSTKENRVSP